MRVVLEQPETGLFLCGIGEWTKKSADAMAFLTAAQAWSFAQEHGLNDVRIVMRFEMHDHSLLLPLTREPKPRDRPCSQAP